jgi:hypothetical protein
MSTLKRLWMKIHSRFFLRLSLGACNQKARKSLCFRILQFSGSMYKSIEVLYNRGILRLKCQNYIVEFSHTIYVNLVKLNFDPLAILRLGSEEYEKRSKRSVTGSV